MLCDMQVITTDYVLDLEALQIQIQENKETCQGLIDECEQYEIAENRFNCLERYGIEKTKEFCLQSLPATDDRFSYKLKNYLKKKYLRSL